MAWETGIQKRRKTFPNINQELMDAEGYIEEQEAKILFYKFLRENPSFASELLTGVKLFPFQHMSIKAMMETDYFLGIWCLDQNEYVLSSEGFKKIKNIEIGDHVRSRNSINGVSNKKTNAPSKGLDICLQSGDSFKSKIGHKTLCYCDGEFIFKEIQELLIGDIIPIKMSTEIWGNKDIIKDSNIKGSPYLFYLLGYVLGDGWVNQDGVHYCSENYEVQETIQNFIKDNDLKTYTRQRTGNLYFYEYSLYDRKLVKWLESFGWDKSLKSKDKIICDDLLQCPREDLCALIGGLFDADGYACFLNTSSKVGLKNTSLQLLRQVKMIFNNMGISSNLRKSGEHKGVPYYDLIISNDYSSLKEFQDSIDFVISHKKENLKKIIARSFTRNYQNNLIPNFSTILKKDGSREKLTGKRGSWGKSFSQNNFDSLKNLSNKTEEIIKNIKNEKVIFSKIKSIEECETVSIDITVENEECYVGNGFVHHNSRGMSKSFSTAVYAILDAILHQGVHIGIISKSFRQAKMIFNKIEEISLSPKAELLAQAITRVSKSNDQWTMEIGRSRITALPLGDGEKLRGFRFQRMIIDELLLMPEKVLNEVIMPFLSVVENPTERQEIFDLETKLIEMGEMTEDDRKQWPNNKIIGLSSASYRFEHLFKIYSQYESLILNENTQDGAHRTIMHFSYDCAPDQLYDQNLINQAKATMSESQFDREFGAVFTDDSSGYFKVSKMMACTIPDGEGQCVEVIGEPEDEYILAIDPSWSESEGSDDFAMLLIKRDKDKPKGIVVHSYAMSGTSLKSHIIYFAYLLNNFNIVSIIMDYNGGVQFMNSCNESEIFKQAGIKLDTIDANFDDLQEYENSLRDARNQYNLQTKKIVYLRKPSSQWIRYANESLQSAFDHRNILFASSAMNDDYHKQRHATIPIKDLKFARSFEDNQPDGAKMIDFVEHQKDMIDLIKVECALVQVTTTAQGTQSFDLPHNLKKQRGADKARKDSYSALVLANWMTPVYFDMINQKAQNIQSTFVPILI